MDAHKINIYIKKHKNQTTFLLSKKESPTRHQDTDSHPCTRSGPLHPVFITKTLHEIQENPNTFSKHSIFISHHFGNPRKPFVGHHRTSQIWKLCLVCLYSDGPKRFASHRVFMKAESCDGGILINYGNVQVLKK